MYEKYILQTKLSLSKLLTSCLSLETKFVIYLLHELFRYLYPASGHV